MGFCRVRGPRDGAWHTFNYGKSVAVTREVIETEAVYHYRPGAPILSLGNVGCMMACSFCQNWETSQVRHLDTAVVETYTPEDVVRIAADHGIDVISWTYNDPVVWHEFVMDTSRLAHSAGIRTLYKSAFYIEEAPAAELIDVIDIFSISLKSMDPEFYRKITRGRLTPVLERIRQVHRSGRHLEISQLVVPGLNDNMDDIRATVHWVLENVGDSVPLHFVGFHPAFKYTDAERTSVATLRAARAVALEAGVRHCYLGNVNTPDHCSTHCESCGHVLVSRYGLHTRVAGIDTGGRCAACGADTPVVEPWHRSSLDPSAPGAARYGKASSFDWSDGVNSVHVAGTNGSTRVRVVHKPTGRIEEFPLTRDLTRVIVSRAAENETGIRVEWESPGDILLHPILDRAHFPVLQPDAGA